MLKSYEKSSKTVGSSFPIDFKRSIHRNKLLVEAGLSPLQALQAATINPAAYFEMTDSLGTVEKGKLADLGIVRCKPFGKYRQY